MILRDTRDACLALAKHGLKGVPEHGDARKLVDSVNRLSSHLVQTRFNLDDAKTASGKVALLTNVLLNGRPDAELAALRYDRGSAGALASVQINCDGDD